jgi:hypothetical protein
VNDQITGALLAHLPVKIIISCSSVGSVTLSRGSVANTSTDIGLGLIPGIRDATTAGLEFACAIVAS